MFKQSTIQVNMLKNIHIKNYRGIKDLKIEDFKRINDKNIVQAFLSTKDEIRDIGSTSSNKIIDSSHNSLQNLNTFLLEFSQL